MAVPLLDLKPQNMALETELKAVFDRVLESGYYILGPEVEAFEQSLASYVGAKHAIAVSSGTDALIVALMALGVGPGDEVICPTFTFFASAGSIARLGAIPVFVDICPKCFNLEPESVAKKINRKTKAIMAVHLFGQAAEMEPLMEIAQRHNIPVIEDAAQSLGARYKERPIGTIGAIGTFSFFPSKNLGCLGDAGMVVTDDEALAEKVRMARMHGSKVKYYHEFVGGNFRIDALQAAFLNVKLNYLDVYNEARQKNAAYYSEKLGVLEGVYCGVEDECGSTDYCFPETTCLILPSAYPHNKHIWNQYTLRVLGAGKRDQLKAFLNERGIGCDIYYPICLHEQACFAGISSDISNLTVSKRISEQCLSIPIFPDLSREQQNEVIQRISEFLGC